VPSQLRRGLSAGSHAPRPPWFAHSLVPPIRRRIAGSESGNRADNETAKCPESLCPISMLPPTWRGVFRLLRGRCPSVLAPTDSCANPAGLSRPSATASFPESWQVPTSLCCPEDLPDVISANLSSDARPSTTAVPQSALTCFFPCVIGLPLKGRGSASRLFPRIRFSAGEVVEAADISLRSGLRVCFASRSFPPLPEDCRRAAEAFYIRAYRASLPPHAPDMLTVRIQAIDGTGTFILSDS
jgi:hypothetical protein